MPHHVAIARVPPTELSRERPKRSVTRPRTTDADDDQVEKKPKKAGDKKKAQHVDDDDSD